jgi:hypothetical protein
VSATVASHDPNPPLITTTLVGFPRYIGCASPPVPPPAFAVNNPGNQKLQVTATGGTTTSNAARSPPM